MQYFKLNAFLSEKHASKQDSMRLFAYLDFVIVLCFIINPLQTDRKHNLSSSLFSLAAFHVLD